MYCIFMMERLLNFDLCVCCVLFSSRRRHTRCALVTGVQTCALPIFLEIALNYSEGPTDGVVEAESGEPLVERFDSPSSLLYSFAWRDMEIGRASCRERVCQYV